MYLLRILLMSNTSIVLSYIHLEEHLMQQEKFVNFGRKTIEGMK